MADIAFTTAAARQMRKLSPDVREQIMAKIESFAKYDNGDIKALKRPQVSGSGQATIGFCLCWKATRCKSMLSGTAATSTDRTSNMASSTKRKLEVRFLNGDFAVVPRAEYDRLLEIEAEAAEDEAASHIIRETQLAIKEGRDILLPRDVADKLIAGDNPVLVIRKWRNVSQAELASAAKLSRENLAEIEQGRRAMTAVLQKRLARALKVPADLFVD